MCGAADSDSLRAGRRLSCRSTRVLQGPARGDSLCLLDLPSQASRRPGHSDRSGGQTGKGEEAGKKRRRSLVRKGLWAGVTSGPAAQHITAQRVPSCWEKCVPASRACLLFLPAATFSLWLPALLRENSL